MGVSKETSKNVNFKSHIKYFIECEIEFDSLALKIIIKNALINHRLMFEIETAFV